jgi:hypothetical protein
MDQHWVHVLGMVWALVLNIDVMLCDTHRETTEPPGLRSFTQVSERMRLKRRCNCVETRSVLLRARPCSKQGAHGTVDIGSSD